MSFKNYLSKIRIGCACRLLTEEEMNISQAAYQSGFENISNFNRHFKQIKGVTPSEYVRAVKVNA
jgi:AraC-like DNA-binding protein